MLTRRMRKLKLKISVNVLRKSRKILKNSKESNMKASLRINRELVILELISTELRIIILKLKSYKFLMLKSNSN
jgi:hypothetical protein